MRTTLKALARFVRLYGYHPKTAELQNEMRVERAPLVEVLLLLQRDRLTELTSAKSGHGRHRIREAGWKALGAEPMEPWRHPPSLSLERRVTERIAAAVLRGERRTPYIEKAVYE
jgi:hypothetical protein